VAASAVLASATLAVPVVTLEATPATTVLPAARALAAARRHLGAAAGTAVSGAAVLALAVEPAGTAVSGAAVVVDTAPLVALAAASAATAAQLHRPAAAVAVAAALALEALFSSGPGP
jgi:hypothetical protein